MPLPQIIVYRIDRLTRSLSDFAKLIDRFDAHDVARNRVRVCCANAADPKFARIVDRDHELPITRQAEAVGLARSTVYYEAVPLSERDQRLMRRIDELHLEHPFAGSRMLMKRTTERWRDSIRGFGIHI